MRSPCRGMRNGRWRRLSNLSPQTVKFCFFCLRFDLAKLCPGYCVLPADVGASRQINLVSIFANDVGHLLEGRPLAHQIELYHLRSGSFFAERQHLFGQILAVLHDQVLQITLLVGGQSRNSGIRSVALNS